MYAQSAEFDGLNLVLFNELGEVESIHYVDQNLSKEHIESLKSVLNVKEIEINKDVNSVFRIRALNEYKNWQLYNPTLGEPLFIESVRKGLSFDFPDAELEQLGYCRAKNKKETLIFNFIDAYNQPVGLDVRKNPNDQSEFTHVLLNFEKKWELHKEPAFPLDFKVNTKFSFEFFPDRNMEANEIGFCIDGKGLMYLADLREMNPIYAQGFNEIVPDTLYDNSEYPLNSLSFFVRLEKYWGKLYYANGFVAMIHGVLYNKPSSIPNDLIGLYPSVYESIEFLRQKHFAEFFVPLDADGFKLLFQNRITRKFGLFYGEGQMTPQIPAVYDSIVINNESDVFIVYRDNRVGYFSQDLDECFPPKFLEIKPFELYGFRWVALRDERGWYLGEQQSCHLEIKEPLPSFEAVLKKIEE